MADETETVPNAVLELKATIGNALTAESRRRGYNFKPSPHDVILSTAPKSGTTWVQHICHGLRSCGDMNFDEITLVFPTLEMAHDYGYSDLQAQQPYTPRMYKTHFWYHDTPAGAGKYIVVVRKPEDAAASFYHFLKDWFFEDGQMTPDEFVQWFYLTRGAPKDFLVNSSQMHHILSWYPHRLDENVLWLHYEDLKENLPECVRLIAEFLDIGKGDEKLQELIVQQASLEFMKKHITKFDSHPLKLSKQEFSRLPVETILKTNTGKLRDGKTNGAKDALSAKTLDLIQEKWKDVIESETGFESYEAFREAINKELGRSFVK